MIPAFVIPTALPCLGAAATSINNQAASPRPSCSRSPSRMTPRCATVSRPSFKSGNLDENDKIIVDDQSDAPQPIITPEVAAVSGTICEFMNREHVRDVANYIVRFGRQFNDLSQLSQVKMVAVDAAGFTADVVSCDESSCVCVQERLDWPLGLCNNADDIIAALKYLSLACGLPADF